MSLYRLAKGAQHDLAISDYGEAPLTAEETKPVEVQTPPTEDETVQHIVEILLAAYTIKKTAELIAALVPGISVSVLTETIKATGGLQGHRAHARLNGMDPSSHGGRVARSSARREIFYRAAYLLRAAARVQEHVHDGQPLPDAIKTEGTIFKVHEKARKNRLDAAAKVGIAANMFGNLLGWYINPLINNEAECLAANGHNFYADQSTVIGDPGAVHLNCHCTAGPPHQGAKLVNEALAASREVVFVQPRRYGLASTKGTK